MRKKTLFILLILTLIISALTGCSGKLGKSEILTQFNANREMFQTIANYMASTGDPGLLIGYDPTTGYIVKQSKDNDAAEKDIVAKGLNTTFAEFFRQYEYSLVLIDTTNVFFVRYLTTHFEQGMIYSMNGNKPTWYNEKGLSNLTILEPLSAPWYYYEGKY